MSRAAAFFDLDKTIIAKSSTLAFGRPFYQGGLINRRAVVRSAYAQFVFALSGADEDQMDRMRDYLTAMCAGWDVQQIRDIVTETLHEIIDPIVYDEAVELIEQHKAEGRDVVVVSSSGSEVVGPISEMVGADRSVATTMVERDGKYTGEIDFYAYGPLQGRGRAGSGRRAGLRPGRELRLLRLDHRSAHARSGRPPGGRQPRPCPAQGSDRRGWPILAFSNAVPLRSRLSDLRPPHPALTAGIAAAGTAVAGAAWLATRRRAARR